MLRAAIFLIVISLYFARAALGQTAASSDMEVKFDRLLDTQNAVVSSARERATLITDTYNKFFWPPGKKQSLSGLAENDLGFFLRAASYVSSYTRDKHYYAQLNAVYAELESRHVATNYEKELYFQSLIELRDFDSARRYRSQHNVANLEPVPEIVRSGRATTDGPTVYRTSGDKPVLLEERVSISHGTYLIVVAHPLCGFSRLAMEQIGSDPELSQTLKNRVLWITPVVGRLYFNDVQGWNLAHPATQVAISRSIADWPMINSWDTPTFYLLQNGKLTGTFSGWPKPNGNREKLIDLLRRGAFFTGDRSLTPSSDSKN